MDIPLEKKRFTPKKIAMIAGTAIIGILILYVILSSTGNSKLNIEKERITINEVKAGNFQEDIPVNGVVLPIKTIYLDAMEGGRVEERFVEDGAMMKKGEAIIRLSNTDLELSLVNQETQVYNLLTQIQRTQNASRQNTINRLNQLTDVKNSLKEAKREFELNSKLYEKGAIGRQDYEESKNNFDYQKERLELTERVLVQDSVSSKTETMQARESYQRTRKALELMRKKVEDLVVKAPVDGQLTALDAEIGQSKSKGERLGQIDVISSYKIQAEIDEHYISRIFNGQIGTFTFNGKDYQLEIKKVYTQVSNGRFKVDMHFVDGVPENIRRGQSLQIKLALSQEKKATLVAKGGFFQQTGGNWIFKISEDGDVAYKTPISLGSQNTEYYEVLEGLEPGDRVITSSYSNFGDVDELVINN
ncbi:efflux RND transporter periplasmic adaptor subunit [Gramella sp. GC03-9]|uniref:Efflux RND transporter periplasmic adaptor subunit n=1 Tax=Christiangramia oceanisediminis TaxID=2920386 RepID=A0A9X2KZJ9_9FLAO|nr:efflux RND transporter periplasmic adaptor subunit [Gramella oceanisediminis]MCP9201273.1 efflux RND transporter periplasmic adaptor subunit [Gramella oceanisediminis]